MPDREEVSDSLSTCESNFERDMMQGLLDRGYRVHGQVGSLGYRIDMVVEGSNGVRLAVECDGDRFHGPEHWQQDMRRQRTLERVGWRFWRCFASSFYRAPEAIINDLCEMLSRLGIEPISQDSVGNTKHRFTEHRTVQTSAGPLAGTMASASGEEFDSDVRLTVANEAKICAGDKVVLVFSDDQKRLSVRLVDGANDLEKGRLSAQSPLGQAVLAAEEGDEIELPLENGRRRKVLIESVESAFVAPVPQQEPERIAVSA
jgi:very-short-patch-repair endonuclease